uniref:Secreted protein n=1 Tax=Strongyloides papillosus TaxID=174720 RepID=A0A0N5C6G2_STREA
MNSLSIAILVGILINISHEYLHNCAKDVTGPCTVWLKPGEAAYRLFLNSLDYSEIRFGIGLCSGETESCLIDEENQLIQKYVSEESK